MAGSVALRSTRAQRVPCVHARLQIAACSRVNARGTLVGALRAQIYVCHWFLLLLHDPGELGALG
jgi:hypothetical protein